MNVENSLENQVVFENDIYVVCLGYKNSSECFFDSNNFITFQSNVQNKLLKVFSLFDKVNEKVIIQFNISSKNNFNICYSPITGAFGFVNILISRLESNIANLFFDAIENYIFNTMKAESISWRLPPESYHNENLNIIINTLFNRGWSVNNIDLNFHYDLDNTLNFKEKLSSSKRRELNRVSRLNTSFKQEFDYEKIKLVYEVICENRYSQNYPMTMCWADLYNLYVNSPDKVSFFSLNIDEVLVASAICLHVDKSYLYVFYWGELPEYRKDSPIIKLAENLFCFAKENNYKILDIGISTDNSKPNKGLIDFKRNIGCICTKKMTMSKSKG